MSRPNSSSHVDLEHSLQSTLDERFGKDVLILCPEHRIVLTTASFEKRHKTCRKIRAGSVLYSDLEIQARLERIVYELYGDSRRIHECGQILHVTSWDRHKITCKSKSKEAKKDEDIRTQEKRKKRETYSDSDSHSNSPSSKKPRLQHSNAVRVQDIANEVSEFISELNKNLNLWKAFLQIIENILASYGMNFKCDDEVFMEDVALIALHFCKGDASFSEEELSNHFPNFRKILKCILQQGHVELLKLKSHGGSATDFLCHAKILFLLEVPESENSILLPDPHDPFFEAESATWIGILDDLFMRLADPLSRYIETTLTEFGISLEVAAKRALGTASNSKVLGIFLKKGSKRSEMDAFLCLSIMIHEFRRICVKFKNNLSYLGKKRDEQIAYVDNLKYVRNKIAHSKNPSLNAFESPRNLSKEGILLSALIVHELAEEIQDSSFLAFIKLQLPKFYPHDLTTIKVQKSIVDMSDEEKQSLLICIEHSQKLGNKLVAIRNSSLKLIFIVPNEHSYAELANAFLDLKPSFPQITIKSWSYATRKTSQNHLPFILNLENLQNYSKQSSIQSDPIRNSKSESTKQDTRDGKENKNPRYLV
jgi:hypothetical protein